MQRISQEEFETQLRSKKPGERLRFNELEIWDMDLSGNPLP